MQPVGQTIYLWRLHRRATQARVAEDAGISRPNLSAIEQGARDLTVQTLRRIAAALGVSPGTLVDGLGPAADAGALSADRHAVDRIARLAAGERVRASISERKIAYALASILKSKTGWKGVKRLGRRTAREENETVARLKAELGPEVFRHLLSRVEKSLAGEAGLE